MGHQNLSRNKINEICSAKLMLPSRGVLQTRSWPRQEAVRCEHQAAIATANSSDMNAACLRMSLFGNQRICPLRIMFTVSIP